VPWLSISEIVRYGLMLSVAKRTAHFPWERAIVQGTSGALATPPMLIIDCQRPELD
jgi:hypothetical protein